MKLLHNIFFVFLTILFVSSCAATSDNKIVQDNKKGPEYYYYQAMIEFEKKITI